MIHFKPLAILLVFFLSPAPVSTLAYSFSQVFEQDGEIRENQVYAQTESISNSADGYINQGNKLAEQGRFQEAIEAYRKAIQIEPNSIVAYSSISEVLQAQGLLDEAIEAYRTVIKLQPNSAIIRNNFGVLLKKGGRLSEAVDAYQQAIKLDPNYAQAYSNLGVALSAQGSLSEAIEVHQKALSISPNNTWFINNLGTALINANRLDEAIKVYENAIAVLPNNANLYEKLCTALTRRNRLEEAKVACDTAVALGSKNPDSIDGVSNYISQGNRLRDRGKLREAVEVYRKAIELNPSSDIALNELGVTLFQQQRIEEALDAFRKAIKIKASAEAYNNLGIALREQGQLDEAAQAYQSALNINPDDTAARNNLSVVLAEQGNRNRSLEEAKEAVKRDPNSALAYTNLGNALRTQGELDQAIEAYRKALSLSDNNPKGVHTEAYNGLGYTLQLQDKLEAAIEEYRKAILLDPNFVPAQNNLEEAKRLLDQLDNNPGSTVNNCLQLPQDEPLVPVLRSVVRVVAPIDTGISRGTGWVVERKGNRVWILTNRHVVTNKTGDLWPNQQIGVEFYCELLPGQYPQRLPANVIKGIPVENSSEKLPEYLQNLDLVLLEVADIPDDIQPLSISTKRVPIGTEIRVIGHPIVGERVKMWTVASGRINALDAEGLQIENIALGQGASGGPVLDSQNQVVGVVFAYFTPNDSDGSGITAPLVAAYSMEKLIDRLRPWGICWKSYENQNSACKSSNLEPKLP